MADTQLLQSARPRNPEGIYQIGDNPTHLVWVEVRWRNPLLHDDCAHLCVVNGEWDVEERADGTLWVPRADPPRQLHFVSPVPSKRELQRYAREHSYPAICYNMVIDCAREINSRSS